MTFYKFKKAINPSAKIFLCVVTGFVFLISLVIIASYLNTHNYYLKSSDGALEIWQGEFAPTSKKRLLTLPGVQVPAPLKPAYTKTEVFPYAFRYYINKADAILSVPGIPDFDGIKTYLGKALTFAVTNEDRGIVTNRLNGIDIMVLIYKADVSASKRSLSDLNTGLDYLYQADKLDLESSQTEMIMQRINSIKKSIKEIKQTH